MKDMHRSGAASNAANLESAIALLTRLIRARLSGQEIAPDGAIRLQFFDDGSPFGDFLRDRRPAFDAYVAIVLTLMPHLRPGLLEAEFRAALAGPGDFPEVGGQREENARLFLPTGETLAFLLVGQDLEGRFHVQRMLAPDGPLAADGLVRLDPGAPGAPVLAGRLAMDRDWVARLTTGASETPAFGADFPARRLISALTWDDLVLPPATLASLARIADWVRLAPVLARDWGMAARLRPGFRALFHGPPGTGKTLTATLLGQATGRPVFRIDLSAVVSKYIGETEKNLATLFDRAARHDWILFFDEADALFGKRTQVKDSHDRYANQEVSYLLQRVEDFGAS